MWQAGTNGAPAAQSKAADSAAIRAAIGGGHKAATSEVNKISSGKAGRGNQSDDASGDQRWRTWGNTSGAPAPQTARTSTMS